MEKIQVYLRKEDLDTLREASAWSGCSAPEVRSSGDTEGRARTARHGPGRNLGWQAEANFRHARRRARRALMHRDHEERVDGASAFEEARLANRRLGQERTAPGPRLKGRAGAA